jgi:hypothetical protein
MGVEVALTGRLRKQNDPTAGSNMDCHPATRLRRLTMPPARSRRFLTSWKDSDIREKCSRNPVSLIKIKSQGRGTGYFLAAVILHSQISS